MSSIQKIFPKQIFIITISYLLITLANASHTDFLAEKAVEANNPTEDVSQPLKTVRILSLDGGGVRGIAEARFLQHLEQSLGAPISDIFHLVGGTSAGGILATFLTTPIMPGSTQPKYSAQELVYILQQRSTDMFVPRYLSCSGFFGPKYQTENFRSVLSEYLGHDTIDNATTPTAVVTYDLQRQNLKTLTSWNKKEIFTKVTAISATAAAATYFEPCLAIPVNNARRQYELSDGGTGANNPTLCLLAKAMELYPDADRFEIISVGSGRANKPLSHARMSSAGLMKWAPHLTRMFMTGETAKDDSFLTEAFGGKNTDSRGIGHSALKGNYSRWNFLLRPENTRLDNTDSENLATLIAAADNHVTSRQPEFNALLERLRSPKSNFNL